MRQIDSGFPGMTKIAPPNWKRCRREGQDFGIRRRLVIFAGTGDFPPVIYVDVWSRAAGHPPPHKQQQPGPQTRQPAGGIRLRYCRTAIFTSVSANAVAEYQGPRCPIRNDSLLRAELPARWQMAGTLWQAPTQSGCAPSANNARLDHSPPGVLACVRPQPSPVASFE